MVTSIDELIKTLGGNAAVASLTGVTEPAVCNWKDRRRIPADKFLILDRALTSKNTRADPALFGFVPDGAAE